MSSAPVTHRPAAPAPSRREPRSLARHAPVAGIAAVMLVAGVWGLARDGSMGNDEVATHFAGLLSISQLFHLLSHVDAVHGLYYLFMHGWMKLGASPAFIRIPSLTAMTGAAVLVVMLARRLTGSAWAGFFAGLIMAATPSVSFYAQTARSYAMVFACVTGSTLILLRAAQADGGGAGPARRWWLAYAAVITLGGYLNELSLAVLAAHAVTLLVARRPRPVLRSWAVTAVISVVLAGPLLVLSQHESGVVDWIGRPGLGSLRLLGMDYFGVRVASAAVVVLCITGALWPGREGRASAWRAQDGPFSLASVALPLLIVPAALLILESLVAPQPLYVDRYVLYGEAGAALLAGGVWSGQASGWPPPYPAEPAGGTRCAGCPAPWPRWRYSCCSSGRSSSPGPRTAGCTTSAGPLITWVRMPGPVTGCCSSAGSTARRSWATAPTSGTRPTLRWPYRPRGPGTSRA